MRRASPRVRAVGAHLAALHDAGFVHGDPTTRNVRVTGSVDDASDPAAVEDAVADARVFLIDFGLGYHSEQLEDHAMDLHVFDQSLVGTARDPAPLREALREGYAAAAGDDRVLDQLAAVEGRGRYQ